MPNTTEVLGDITRWEREVRVLQRRYAVIPPLVQSTIDLTLEDGAQYWSTFIISDRDYYELQVSELVQYYLDPVVRSLAREVDAAILRKVYSTLTDTYLAPFLPRFTRENARTNLITAKQILNNHEAPHGARSLIMGPCCESEVLMSGYIEQYQGTQLYEFNSIVSSYVDDLSPGLSLAWHYNAIEFTSNLQLSMCHIQHEGTEVKIMNRITVSILNPIWIILFEDRA